MEKPEINTVTLNVTIGELDYINNTLGAVPTLNTLGRGMMHLIPKLAEQAQRSIQQQQAEREELAAKQKRLESLRTQVDALREKEAGAGLKVEGGKDVLDSECPASM